MDAVNAVLEQLKLNVTFFYQLAIFAVLFFLLTRLYFRPFLKLFEARHQRTIEDREAAEKLMGQADAKFEEYKRRLAEERALAKKDYEAATQEARRQEAQMLAHAREEAKKITQEAVESIHRQREQLKSQLVADVETLANGISERLLKRS